ncbi:hypothetical protein NC653_027810 [Populus alba x Populus x berolinensis]|uniref:Uncharacterized protein n=1 Tax=Populus alba x Populus x berolinensis TaxID=444605 RepID=A0AAD6Q6M1_9ROSI|nr:hypothetical protein NC653_027810 [Populus alba x Populus x berolinensis]
MCSQFFLSKTMDTHYCPREASFNTF